ncbi:MAG: recombinase family protein [Phycisphaerae bacterium]|nr:recombinase family protein [Phycisphaerae bacterium]
MNRRKIETARASGWSDRYSGLWAAATVRAILVNPAYRGDLVWNRRTDARFFRITGDGNAVERIGSRGRRLEVNDRKDWIETRDSHPAIISRRVWELAQLILHGKPSSKEQRGKPKNTRPGEMTGAAWVGPKARFLLSSLCECSKCGSRYEGHGAPTGKHVEGTERSKTWSYACGGYIRRGRSTCSRGGVPMDALDESVVAVVLRYYERFAGANGANVLERTIQRQIGGESDSVERSRTRLAAQRDKLDGLVRNLVDNLTDTNRDHVDRRLLELTKQREMLERDLRSLDHMAIGQTAIADLKDEVKSFLTRLPETLGNGRPELRRAALQRCIERVVIEREKRAATVMVRCVPAIAGGPRGGAVEAVEVKLKGLGK